MPETPGEMMDFVQRMMHRAMRNTVNMFKRMNMKESGMHMINQVGYTAEVRFISLVTL